jgi:hypothetical protein
LALFFKLNNHSNSAQGFAAYYHTQSPHDHVGWNANTDILAGQTLYLSSNDFGVRHTALGPNGHFGVPEQGDLIIIFQRVCNVPRVVTHILEFTDNLVSTFQETFPNMHHVIAAFEKWPYLRTTRIVSVLNPNLCGKVMVRHKPDLKLTGTLPKGAVTFDALGGGFTPNGRIRLNTDKFINPNGLPQVTIAQMEELIFENPAYLHDVQ